MNASITGTDGRLRKCGFLNNFVILRIISFLTRMVFDDNTEHPTDVRTSNTKQFFLHRFSAACEVSKEVCSSVGDHHKGNRDRNAKFSAYVVCDRNLI